MKIENPSEFHLAVQAFIKKEKILQPGQPVICAISGGVDSMVLGTVLLELGFQVTVAHYNFKLRGNESNEDEAYVRNWAKEKKLSFHLGTLPHPDFWKKEGKGKNIQLEARNLRYEWLNKLKTETGIDCVATGHHADDQEETILMNFFRGTGISGLRGILPNSGGIVRPLLIMPKKSIIQYAREKVKQWRNDSSNEGDSYKRNEIRHHLKPILDSIFPGFHSVVNRNSERIRLVEKEIEIRFQGLFKQFSIENQSGFQAFDFAAIQTHESGLFFLSELFQKAGFEFEFSRELAETSISTESRSWSKGKYCVELKGNTLILNKIKEIEIPLKIRILTPGKTYIPGLGHLTIETEKEFDNPFSLNHPDICYLDTNPIIFPLFVELWKPADKFKPFGMKGNSKLVSDLLTEKGYSQLEKNRTLVVRNGDGQILWVVGIRSSELGKITKDTRDILKLVWKKET